MEESSRASKQGRQRTVLVISVEASRVGTVEVEELAPRVFRDRLCRRVVLEGGGGQKDLCLSRESKLSRAHLQEVRPLAPVLPLVGETQHLPHGERLFHHFKQQKEEE